MENNNNAVVQQKPQNKIDILKNIMNADSVQQQFKNALKDNAPAFIASVIDLFNSDTGLQECDPNAVVKECLRAAVLKLPINKQLGFAYIIPFNKSIKTQNGWTKIKIPTFQIGYKGYIQLGLRTAQYRHINADVVYEGEYKTKNKLTGEFDLSGEKISDTIIGYFAYFELLNGFSKTLYMTADQVQKHAERYSPGYKPDDKNNIWHKDKNFHEMAIKTPLRGLLSRYGYLSTEMISAISNDIDSENVQQEVQQHINTNANKTVMSFDDAEVVGENKSVQSEPEPGEDACPI